MSAKDDMVQINATYQKLSERADKLYQFILLYSDYMARLHDYGTKHLVSMIEVHTLTDIEDCPGITITELARKWGKTKGALSQTVKKLVEKGLVFRSKEENNSKIVLLRVTPEGAKLSQAHKLYDLSDAAQTLDALKKTCSAEEIEAFYKVIESYSALLK